MEHWMTLVNIKIMYSSLELVRIFPLPQCFDQFTILAEVNHAMAKLNI